jgi:hypothetical protein
LAIAPVCERRQPPAADLASAFAHRENRFAAARSIGAFTNRDGGFARRGLDPTDREQGLGRLQNRA